MAYEIKDNAVVYTESVRADKDSQATDVRWTFDFSNVQDVRQLWKMSVEPSGLVVKAQARWRRGKVSADATFDVQADFLDKAKVRKSKTDKVKETLASMSEEDRAAILAELENTDSGQAAGQSGKKSGK